MENVYIIQVNDGLLTDEVYSDFDYACYICETMLGFRPKKADYMYDVEPMKFVRIKSMGFV